MLFAICFSLIYILNYARAIDEVTALNRRKFISSARLEYVKVSKFWFSKIFFFGVLSYKKDLKEKYKEGSRLK